MKDFSFWNDFLIPWFQEIGYPAHLARQLAERHGLESRTDIEGVARGLGYEIEYVTTLPLSVSGFVKTFEDTHYIIVNRNFPPEHMQYTIAHELAHHLLNHSAKADQHPQMLEFQAHLFSSFWLYHTLPAPEFERYCQENSEAMNTQMLFALSTAGVLFAGGIAGIISWLASRASSKTEGTRWEPNPPSVASIPASQAAIS